MRRLALIAFSLGCLLGGRASAESPVPLVAIDDLRAEPSPRVPRLGLALGAGVPSGATAELVVRPWRVLRLQAGVAYDLVSPGVVAGVAVAPFRTALAPVLSLHAGRLFEGDANGLITVDRPLRPLLQRVGYDFASAELGLEIGAPDAFAFTVSAGLSAIRSTLHGANAALGLTSAGITVADPTLRAVLPSGRVGFVFFI